MGNIGFCCNKDEDDEPVQVRRAPVSDVRNTSSLLETCNDSREANVMEGDNVRYKKLHQSTCGSNEISKRGSDRRSSYFSDLDLGDLGGMAMASNTKTGSMVSENMDIITIGRSGYDESKTFMDMSGNDNHRLRKNKNKMSLMSDIIAKPLPFHADTGEDIQQDGPMIDMQKGLKRTVSLKKKLSLLNILEDKRIEENDRQVNNAILSKISEDNFMLGSFGTSTIGEENVESSGSETESIIILEQNTLNRNAHVDGDLIMYQHVHTGKTPDIQTLNAAHVTCSSY